MQSLQVKKSPARWIGIILALVGVGVMVGGCYFVQKQMLILRTWPIIEAEVVASEITSHRSSDDDSTTYGVLLTFHFNLHGQEYTASRDRGYTSSSYSSMEKMAARFAPGTRHAIRYNPQRPVDIRFNAGYTLEFFAIPLFLLVFGLIFLLVGLAVARAKGSPDDSGTGSDACPTCQTPVPASEKFCPKCGTMLHEG